MYLRGAPLGHIPRLRRLHKIKATPVAFDDSRAMLDLANPELKIGDLARELMRVEGDKAT
jgi:hypothetical protein